MIICGIPIPKEEMERLQAQADPRYTWVVIYDKAGKYLLGRYD